MKKYGFLKTFIEVCSGTAIFPEIVKFPLRRMVWHLFLLSILGGFVNVAFRYYPINTFYQETCQKLQDKFGDIKFSEKGITPTKNPENSGKIYLDNLQINYFPEKEGLKDFKPGDESYYGICWTPHSVFIWILSENNAIPLYPLIVPTSIGNEESSKLLKHLGKMMQGSTDSTLSPLEMAELSKIPTGDNKNAKIPFIDFKTNIIGLQCKITTLAIIMLFSDILTNCLIYSPLYILIFSLFSFFLGKSSVLPLKFREIFIVGIYTGFPGIVIGTLYTALHLPYLNFQSIFLLAYFFYSFPVFSRLRFSHIQNEVLKNNDQND